MANCVSFVDEESQAAQKSKLFSAAAFHSIQGLDGNVRTIVSGLSENDFPRSQCKEGVVFAHAYIFARMVLGTALSNQNVAGLGQLTAKDLYPEAF